MNQNEKSRFWNNQTVVVLSDESNLFLIIRGLLRALGWAVDITTEQPVLALNEIINQRASCLIVVDTPTSPAAEQMRILFRNPIARLTPVMTLSGTSNKQDILIYNQIFKSAFASKPLTPNNFFPSFKKMLQTWEFPAMQALRRVSQNSQKMSDQEMINILGALASDVSARALALEAEVAILVNNGKLKEAESKLIDEFKIKSNSIHAVTQLAWFYMKCHLPDQALKYFMKLKSAAPMSQIFNLDIASCHLACGNVKDAFAYLKSWHEAHAGNEFAEIQLAKIIVSQGLTSSAEINGISKTLIKRIEDLWQASDIKQRQRAQIQGIQPAS
jgi:tetratricopeptide (TPR) repeat protein